MSNIKLLTQTLLKDYIKNEIVNLIYYIQQQYPKIMNDSLCDLLINKYCNLDLYKLKKYTNTQKKNIVIKVSKKIFIRKFKNKNSYRLTRSERDTCLKFNDTKCYARIWNNGSIIKLENGTIIYGKQCTRKKAHKTYCNQHFDNNPHSDFNIEPVETIKLHYKKYHNMK